jgi:hypothetical protein
MMPRVEVYRNLHKQALSVRECNGLVLTHEQTVFIGSPRFVVQPAGRAKVIREQRKNVHAFVRGELLGFSAGTLKGFEDYTEWSQATYNPYAADTFYDRAGGYRYPILTASRAVVTTTGVYYA